MTTINSPQDPQRLQDLKQWLSSLKTPQLAVDTMRVASADASFRRYFRIDGQLNQESMSFIVMDAPQPQEDVKPFIQIANLFAQLHLTVPQVLAEDTERGFLLLSDLGSTMYSHVLNTDTAHKLYLDAIDSLVLLQSQSQADVLPEYDRDFLLRELMIFPEWYIQKHLGVNLTESQTASLQKVFDALLANIVAQPQVYVHRDFHSRNLMLMDKGNPGILDFQGALYGPITYDLVSLLRDAYVQWDEEMVLDWAIRYWEKARKAGLPVAPDIDSFYRDFEFMGLQRHLKILGIFARLAHRDGKQHYLDDMPTVLDYVRKTANRYKELVPLLRLLDSLEDAAPQFGYTF
ncbi:aminoglycoside phosphotransferase family protein [Undibacterium fentianense]|uniref:Phosphotransferase n=1 Tax=Undibacterium fentianense TaxID=2828728 RepID=A0A941DZJ1_9BURK|nr:phosphotransferase [Undibacterium fentianense]MBR7799690.1 phosphotransferase [Undibacterium fentianense]